MLFFTSLIILSDFVIFFCSLHISMTPVIFTNEIIIHQKSSLLRHRIKSGRLHPPPKSITTAPKHFEAVRPRTELTRV